MIDFASFHPDCLTALNAAGWYPERRVEVRPLIDSLTVEGYPRNPLAEEILGTLEGLTVEPINLTGPNFINEPFSFDPIAAGTGHRWDLAAEVEEVLGGKYFPLGEWLSNSSVFIEAGGRVVATGLGWIWEVGSSFEEALQMVVRADRPLVCLHADSGLDPWPL